MARRRGGLTPKQEAFVREYLIDLNATQAARRAGYSERTARQAGAENLSKPVIQAAIQEGQRARKERTESDADRVVRELARLAYSDLRKLVDWGPDGVALKDSAEIPDDAAACVESVSQTTSLSGGSIKIKLHSKVSALGLLAKHLGLLKDPTPLEILLAALPPELGAAIRRALGGHVPAGPGPQGGDPAHAPHAPR